MRTSVPLFLSLFLCSLLLLVPACEAPPPPAAPEPFAQATVVRQRREKAGALAQALETGQSEAIGRMSQELLSWTPAEVVAEREGLLRAAGIGLDGQRLSWSADLCDGLAHLGPSALGLIDRALSDERPEVRGRCAAAMSTQGEEGMRVLVTSLGRLPVCERVAREAALTGAEQESRAAEGQERLQSVEFLARLYPRPQAEDTGGDAACQQALADLRRRATERLTELLADPYAPVQVAAVEALADFGPAAGAAAPAFARLMREQPEGAGSVAETQIHRLGPATVEALRPLLAEPAARVRRSAIVALGRLGAVAPAVEAVLAQAADADAGVRAARLRALAPLASIESRAAVALTTAVSDTEPAVRLEAIRLLGIDAGIAGALQTLIGLLSNSDPVLVGAALDALGELGAAGKPARAEVERLCRQGPAGVRRGAVRTLARLESDPFARAQQLSKLLHDAPVEVRTQAALELAALGPIAQTVSEPLAQAAANDPDLQVRQAALQALRGVRPVQARPSPPSGGG